MDPPFGCGSSAWVLTGPAGLPGQRGPSGPDGTGPTGPPGPLAYAVVAERFVPSAIPTDTMLMEISSLPFGIYELRILALRRHFGVTNSALLMEVSNDGNVSYLATQSGVQGFAWNLGTAPLNTNTTVGFVLSNIISDDDTLFGTYTLYYFNNQEFMVSGLGLLADPNDTTTPNPTRTLLTGGRTTALVSTPLTHLRFRTIEPDSFISGRIQLVQIVALPP
jgi:hypothetical protein